MPCFLALIYPAALYALFRWARWLRWRTKAPRFAAWVAYTLVGLAVAGPAATLATVAMFLIAMPSQGARGSESPITVDIDLSYLLVFVSPPLLAVAWLLVCTWRWHWAVRPQAVRGDPPYR